MSETDGGQAVLGQVTVTIDLPAHILQAFYRGQVAQVQATAEDGRQVRLPLRLLRPYFSHNGLQGRFALQFDGEGRALSLTRA